MSRVRVLLAWLVLAALPLQGFAAASMLFCGMGAGEHGAVAMAQSGESHATHGHGHHAHADGAQQHDTDGARDATANGASDTTADGPGDATAGAASHPDSGHRCAVCASCCTLAAIAQFPRATPAVAPPAADLPQLSIRVSTRATTLPDKPPRA